MLLLLIEPSSMLDKLASCALLLPSLLAAKLSSHLLLKLVEVKVACTLGICQAVSLLHWVCFIPVCVC